MSQTPEQEKEDPVHKRTFIEISLKRRESFSYGLPTRIAAAGMAEAGSLPPGLDSFPIPRPQGWPEMMSWPNAEIVHDWPTMSVTYERAVLGSGAEREAARERMREVIMNYAIAAEVMKEREEIVRERLVSADARIDRRVMKLQVGRFFGRDDDKPMSWACLLRVHANGDARIQNVAAFSNTAARTTDGGIVLADDKGVIVTRPSPQAIELLIVEAASRGWPEVRVSGNRELCDMALKICRQHNVEAVIQERWNGIPMRQHKVMRSFDSHDAIRADAQERARQAGFPPGDGPSPGGMRDITPLARMIARGPLADAGCKPLRDILAAPPRAPEPEPDAPEARASEGFMSGARNVLSVDSRRSALAAPDEDLDSIPDAEIT